MKCKFKSLTMSYSVTAYRLVARVSSLHSSLSTPAGLLLAAKCNSSISEENQLYLPQYHTTT